MRIIRKVIKTNKTKTVPKKRYRKTSVKSLTKAVKAVVISQAEKKQTSASITLSCFAGNGTSWSAIDIIAVSPSPGVLNISQGTTQATRIGNSVRIHKMMMNFVFFPLSYNVTTNPQPIPQIVMMWLVSVKGQGSSSPASQMASFFQIGSTSTSLQGNVTDLLYEVNKDLFTVYKKTTFKLGFAAAVGTGFNAGQQQYANNDFPYSVKKSWNITKLIPKICRFNDGSNANTGRALYLIMQSIPADGSTPAVTTVPCQMDMQLICHFTD